MSFFLEACCTSLDAVKAAGRIGARRIEMCEQLDVGGVTPSEALLRAAVAMSTLPINVLVRPREGDFIYSATETETMLDSIRMCGRTGVNGVVAGALMPDGSVDVQLMKILVSEARAAGLSVTFHRAFDECADPMKALEDIISLGCDRLLTSGHASNAYEGREMIGALVRAAAGRIVIMAGCGVRPGNIADIAAASSAPEYHSSRVYEPWPL